MVKSGSEKAFVIDLNRIKAREFAEMQEDLASGDIARSARWFAKSFLEWPYEADPNEVESYLNLGLGEYMRVSAEFGNAIKSLSEALTEERTTGSGHPSGR